MNERETHQLPGSSSRTTADAEPRGVPSVAAIATQTAREIYATLVEERKLLRSPQHAPQDLERVPLAGTEARERRRPRGLAAHEPHLDRCRATRNDGGVPRKLPTGVVTLLFTDIEGSTRLLHELGDGYGDALDHHRRVVRTACTAHDGLEVDTQGDAFFMAFARASDAAADTRYVDRSAEPS
jgi:hypothetical protein